MEFNIELVRGRLVMNPSVLEGAFCSGIFTSAPPSVDTFNSNAGDPDTVPAVVTEEASGAGPPFASPLARLPHPSRVFEGWAPRLSTGSPR